MFIFEVYESGYIIQNNKCYFLQASLLSLIFKSLINFQHVTMSFFFLHYHTIAFLSNSHHTLPLQMLQVKEIVFLFFCLS